MSESPVDRPTCEAALRFLDSFSQNEAVAESDRDLLKHLNECPGCSREREARVLAAERLKQTVQSQPVDPYLEVRIRRMLREHGSHEKVNRGWRRLIPVAAVLVMCLGTWIAFQLGHLRVTTASQESYIRTISARVSGILGVGLGDHVHCTVFRKFPKTPPSASDMARDLGPEYGGLLERIRPRVPAEYRLVMAHRCSYHGRKFVHLALRSDSKLLSLVITRKVEGESFAGDRLRPVTSESGVSIYEGGVQRFAIAGFETSGHLAYLVSDLDERENRSLFAALSLPVRDFLGRLEI